MRAADEAHIHGRAGIGRERDLERRLAYAALGGGGRRIVARPGGAGEPAAVLREAHAGDHARSGLRARAIASERHPEELARDGRVDADVAGMHVAKRHRSADPEREMRGRRRRPAGELRHARRQRGLQRRNELFLDGAADRKRRDAARLERSAAGEIPPGETARPRGQVRRIRFPAVERAGERGQREREGAAGHADGAQRVEAAQRVRELRITEWQKGRAGERRRERDQSTHVGDIGHRELACAEAGGRVADENHRRSTAQRAHLLRDLCDLGGGGRGLAGLAEHQHVMVGHGGESIEADRQGIHSGYPQVHLRGRIDRVSACRRCRQQVGPVGGIAERRAHEEHCACCGRELVDAVEHLRNGVWIFRHAGVRRAQLIASVPSCCGRSRGTVGHHAVAGRKLAREAGDREPQAIGIGAGERVRSAGVDTREIAGDVEQVRDARRVRQLAGEGRRPASGRPRGREPHGDRCAGVRDGEEPRILWRAAARDGGGHRVHEPGRKALRKDSAEPFERDGQRRLRSRLSIDQAAQEVLERCGRIGEHRGRAARRTQGRPSVRAVGDRIVQAE